MNKNKETIERIRQVYREKNYNMSQFAELIGMSKSAWVRRESQQVLLTLDEIENIAEKLDTDFGTLTDSSNSFNIDNVGARGLMIGNGHNASVTIHLSDTQLDKVMDILKED